LLTGRWVPGLRLGNGSRVSCEVHARFYEGPRGRFPRSTHLVVLGMSQQAVERAREVATEWLKGMGLGLKASKTRITHTLQRTSHEAGFEFLGFQVRQYPVGKCQSGKGTHGKLLAFKTLIKPAAETQKDHLKEMEEVVRKQRSLTQGDLIKRLNPIIRGWSSYYSTVVAKETFTKMDHQTYVKLRRWAKRRHPHKTGGWIAKRYWHVDKGSWTFAAGKGLKLCKHAETPIIRHIKVKGNRSPYDGDWIYWATRLGRHPETSKKRGYLLKRQEGKCPWCGLYFKHGDEIVECDHVLPKSQGGRDRYANQQLLHGHCHDEKTAGDRRGTHVSGQAHRGAV